MAHFPRTAQANMSFYDEMSGSMDRVVDVS